MSCQLIDHVFSHLSSCVVSIRSTKNTKRQMDGKLWKQLYIWERSVCESVYEVIVVWQRMQRVSGCQRWWSNHVSWQPAWGDEKWQMGLGRARPSLLSVPTQLDAEPSLYRDSRATDQKKAFFPNWGGLLVYVSSVLSSGLLLSDWTVLI